MIQHLTDTSVLGFFCCIYRLSVLVLRLRAKGAKAVA